MAAALKIIRYSSKFLHNVRTYFYESEKSIKIKTFLFKLSFLVKFGQIPCTVRVFGPILRQIFKIVKILSLAVIS